MASEENATAPHLVLTRLEITILTLGAHGSSTEEDEELDFDLRGSHYLVESMLDSEHAIINSKRVLEPRWIRSGQIITSLHFFIHNRSQVIIFSRMGQRYQ